MEEVVKIPSGVEVSVDGLKLSVKGPLGKLERDFRSQCFIGQVKVEKGADTVKVSTESYKRHLKAEVGTIAATLTSMIGGVTKGYTYKLKSVFMHFPMSVKVQGNKVVVTNFLGEKAPRTANIVSGTKVEIKGDELIVTGNDRESVGQTSANIESATKIQSRDRRVFQDGIFITSKGD
jgi:large subunit ribosomal protein L6